MEKAPENENNQRTRKFASDFYTAVDWLFDVRKVPDRSDLFNNRYSKLELDQNEINFIGPNLEQSAIDAPESVEITLFGRNPEVYKTVMAGGIRITMNHYDTFGDEITSTYSIWLDRLENDSVVARKDVKKYIGEREPSEFGVLPAPYDTNNVIYKNKPLDQFEQQALLQMIKAL
jgi:hypothetical protein